MPSLGLRVPLALDMRWDLVTPFPLREAADQGDRGREGPPRRRPEAEAEEAAAARASSSSAVCLETFDFEGRGGGSEEQTSEASKAHWINI